MENEHIYLFLDNPETLESITFSLHKYYKREYGNKAEADSSLKITHGCSISPAFDKEVSYFSYGTWDKGQAELNKAYAEWASKGFKTRKELGIIDKDDNLTHDQLVYSIRRQLFELYIKAKAAISSV